MNLLRIAAVLALLGLVSPALHAAPKTQVRLLLPVEAAKPGDEILAGVELRMPLHYHTYWRNSGDSGFPTEIKWELPKGISAGAIQWPVPEKTNDQVSITYMLQGTALLLVPLKLAPNLAPGEVEIKAKVSWVECEKNCLPGDGNVQAKLVIGNGTKASSSSDLIQSAKEKIPKSGASLNAMARWDGPEKNGQRPLLIQWDSPATPGLADFYPDSGKGYKIEGATENRKIGPGKLAVRKVVTKEKDGGVWPKEVRGLIVMRATSFARVEAFEVALNIASGARANRGALPGVANQTENPSLLLMLGFAFLGGLILNIMPCVLPVIALKVLGFVNQSKEDPRRVRQLGVIYTLGVLASFVVLAGIVIGLQQAGEAVNWGIQFQNPQFLVAMTALVTLVALNLFGVFEVTLGGGAMNAAGALAAKEGSAGAFFNGVLATALATPCTAPYLTTALAFAFAQPPLIIVLVFCFIGLGLAAPYLLLSWKPEWGKFLPRPGAWMEKFKVALGFPMLATAAYLLWLTTAHFGTDGVLWLGLFLVTLAGAAWVWGEFGQRSSHRGVALATSVVLLLASYFFVLEGELQWRSPRTPENAGASRPRKLGDLDWLAWNPEAVATARAAGRPVLLDFTADWCPNCKWNEKTSLNISPVKKKLEEINGVAVLVDYTRRNPEITEEIQKLGRAAIPLTVVYPANPNEPPIILETLLTPQRVLDALDQAARVQVASKKE